MKFSKCNLLNNNPKSIISIIINLYVDPFFGICLIIVRSPPSINKIDGPTKRDFGRKLDMEP